MGTYSVVQILTDMTNNASASKGARTLIERRHPHIFWSGCMANTSSLLMKDIAHSIHSSLFFIGDCYEKAKGIVKYIKNHFSALHIFRTFSSLDVIKVNKTRFGHHYIILERIAHVKNALINLVLSVEWDKLKKGGVRENMEHDGVRQIVLDDDFWKQLKTILAFTKPIWQMIRFCDSDKAILGEVYQRMEDMLGYIQIALKHNVEMYQVIQKLVTGRWEKMNQPLHALAYVLTPYYYSESWLTSFSPTGGKMKKTRDYQHSQTTYFEVVD